MFFSYWLNNIFYIRNRKKSPKNTTIFYHICLSLAYLLGDFNSPRRREMRPIITRRLNDNATKKCIKHANKQSRSSVATYHSLNMIILIFYTR